MAAGHAAPTVLVVDDDPAVTEMICTALEDAGLRTRGCTQAAEAFWFIQRAPPKVVILDVRMPGVDGIALLLQLRADTRTAGLPVIFHTAHADDLRRRLPNLAALGAQVLEKPCNLGQLLDLVHRALSPRADGG